MALVRVYCGLSSNQPSGSPTAADEAEPLTVAVVDDSGRLLRVCEVPDSVVGYANLRAVLAERSGGADVEVAADSDEHQITLLLAAAGRPLAIVDEETLDDYAERFCDDDSPDERAAPPALRRAIGLARALQAGALAASVQGAPRELTALKPILVAHSAVAAGRQSAAVALREVLRELYPAALRAYPDPCEPVPLAILDALPEPGLLGSGSRGRDEAVIAELTSAGIGDARLVTDAVTALRVAISETPRRAGIGKSLTTAVSETIRQSVAAVRACDSAADALLGLLIEKTAVPEGTRRPAQPARQAHELAEQPGRSGARRARTTVPPVTRTAAPASAAAAAGQPPATPEPMPQPVAAQQAPRPPAPMQPGPMRHAPMQPGPMQSGPMPAQMQPGPMQPGPMQPGPMQSGPMPAQMQPSPMPAQMQSGPMQPASAPPAMAAPPAASPTTAPPGPAHRHPDHLAGLSGQYGPPEYGPQEVADAEPPAPAAPERAYPSAAYTKVAFPAPRPAPEVTPPGSRDEWPLATNGYPGEQQDPLDGSGYALTNLPPTVLDRRRQPAPAPAPAPTPAPAREPRDNRIAPPWQDEVLSGAMPILTYPEPPGAAEYGPEPLRAPREPERARFDAPYGPPPLRLVEPNGGRAPAMPIASLGEEADEGDGDLLIFAAARSAWFTGTVEEPDDSLAWGNDADLGWRAAERASEPVRGEDTTAGLPKRVPQANLVPGSALPPVDERGLRIVRDPAAMAAHTTGYFRGSRRGEEVRGFAVGGRPGRDSAGGWEFSRDSWEGDEGYEYRSAARQ